MSEIYGMGGNSTLQNKEKKFYDELKFTYASKDYITKVHPQKTIFANTKGQFSTCSNIHIAFHR